MTQETCDSGQYILLASCEILRCALKYSDLMWNSGGKVLQPSLGESLCRWQRLPGEVHAQARGLVCNKWGFGALGLGAVDQDLRSDGAGHLSLDLDALQSPSAAAEVELGSCALDTLEFRAAGALWGPLSRPQRVWVLPGRSGGKGGLSSPLAAASVWAYGRCWPEP